MQEPRQALSNRILLAAFAVSATVHASALAIHFVDPEALRVKSMDPPLEIILVNARSDSRPSRPEALAQANLDGGGANDSGRRTSPLPNAFEIRDGDSLDAAKTMVKQLEEEQKKLLAQFQVGPLPQPSLQKDPKTADAARGSAQESLQQLARMQAEISKQISDYQKRPRKHHFMPSTSEYRYARYVEDWRVRVERIGNEHYPDDARGKLYGALRMTVAIRKDGSLVDAVIEESSGSQVLDRAARRIVKLSSPYPPFPPDIAKDTDVLEITRTWVFTNDQFATRSAPAANGVTAKP